MINQLTNNFIHFKHAILASLDTIYIISKTPTIHEKDWPAIKDAIRAANIVNTVPLEIIDQTNCPTEDLKNELAALQQVFG